MTNRWDALDVLRGLTIILMLMNLTPGSWEHNYAFLVHAKWEGWTLIDMVAPTLRNAGQAWFSGFVEPRAASLLFALCGIGVIFLVLLVCHRKRWILKL